MKRLISIICILCLVILPLPRVCADDETAAPDVRVRLVRLALTDRADIDLSGSWLVRGSGGSEMLFPSGGDVVVQLRNGNMILFFGQISASFGNTVSFIRQDGGEGTPYLRFSNRQEQYPGDLSLSVSDGQLNPVLTISVEDYIRGVVPYEMSESFPLEALKAQAVCARTYALSRVDGRKSYDVVDTTNDQVFRGILPSNTKTARACSETAGVVITSQGRLAQGYYSASNGGQTELPSHVWGGKDPSPCYAVTDDPYDLENPESMVRNAVLRKDASGLGSYFVSLVRDAVMSEAEMKGYSSDPELFRIDSIDGVELTTPRYDSPSRLMTVLKLTVSVSAAKAEEAGATPSPSPSPSPTPRNDPDSEELALFDTPAPTISENSPVFQEEPPTQVPNAPVLESAGTYTVSLNMFPDAVFALGLSISGANNEIVTVTETDDAFRLSSGRFGHGVGMSQRGAQWMAAKYGMGFEEILAFYFPGMELKQTAHGLPVLPTPDPVLADTPGPAATPTPRPTLMPVSEENIPDGAYLASVENIDDDSSLNLRAEPSQGAEILMRLYKHQLLVVLEENQVPGWAHVMTDSIEGYVMTSFLEKAE